MSSPTRLAVTATSLCLAAAAWSPAASACGDQPFIGEVCIVAFNFAPPGYALTNGALLAISPNIALFSVLGTTYGGNGTTNFALPDTRGRVIIGLGQGPGTSNYVLGQMDGRENVTLTVAQMPAHSHAATTTVVVKAVGVGSAGNADSPAGNAWAFKERSQIYSNVTPNVQMAPAAVQVSSATTTVDATGGSQPFSILPPYLVLNPIIATAGLFPSHQ